MDIEYFIDETIDALNDSDDSQWEACYWIWEASQTGYPKWAELIGISCGIGDDQARNRANAWSVYLMLLDETDQADSIRDDLYFSHFVIAYRYIDEPEIFDTLFQARYERMSYRSYAALLDNIFGTDPLSRFIARYGRFKKELAYILGMAESNRMPDEEQAALRVLLKFWNE